MNTLVLMNFSDGNVLERLEVNNINHINQKQITLLRCILAIDLDIAYKTRL